MPDVKISQLPSGTANANAVVPATNAAGTTTQKVTLGSIVGLAHQHTISQVTDLETTLGQKLDAPGSATAGDVLTYSDGSWVAAAPTGGGDYLPLAGGTMTGNIVFDGTSGQYVGKGSFDTSRGGNYGLSLVCSVGYELNWQAGYLIATEQDHVTPRPLYIDSGSGTTVRAWADNGGAPVWTEISHTGITFPDGTSQASAGIHAPAAANHGDVLTYDSANGWLAAAPSGGGSLPNGSSVNDLLTWDGSQWYAAAAPQELPTGSINTGDVLTWDGSAWNAAAPTGTSLPNGNSQGDLLSWNGSAWAAVMPSTPGLPSASQYQVLVYDGTNWVSQSLYGGSYSPLTAGSNAGDTLVWDGLGNWVAQMIPAGIPYPSAMPNTGDVLTYNGTAWEPSWPGGGYTAPLYGRCQVDESQMSVSASTSLTLSPLNGSSTYYVEGLAVLEGQADSSVGLKLSAGTSDGDVFLDHDYQHDASGNYWSTARNTGQTDSPAVVSSGWMSTVTTPIRFRGWVVTGSISSTSIALHFGSASGMATITLKAGSWIVATKVA